MQRTEVSHAIPCGVLDYLAQVRRVNFVSSTVVHAGQVAVSSHLIFSSKLMPEIIAIVPRHSRASMSSFCRRMKRVAVSFTNGAPQKRLSDAKAPHRRCIHEPATELRSAKKSSPVGKPRSSIRLRDSSQLHG